MTTVADGAVESAVSRFDGGFLLLYDGQTLLAQMRFADPAFGPVENGYAAARPLMVGTAQASGTATQWVALTTDRVPLLVGQVGKDMEMKQRYVAQGAEVRVASFTYRQL